MELNITRRHLVIQPLINGEQYSRYMLMVDGSRRTVVTSASSCSSVSSLIVFGSWPSPDAASSCLQALESVRNNPRSE